MSTSSGRFRLAIKKGPNPGKTFDLTQIVAIIGRDASADIAVSDVEVSRQHARLSATESGFTIEDLASTNGVFVNGVRITAPTDIKDGDVIGIGQTVELAVEGIPAEGAATVFTAQPAVPPLPSMGSTPEPASPVVGSSGGSFNLPPSPGPSAPVGSSAAPASSGGRPSWLPWAVGGGCLFLLLCVCLPAAAWAITSAGLFN